MAEKQLMMEELLEGVDLSQLGMTKTDWNIARNLMCKGPNDYNLFDFTLARVVSNPLKRNSEKIQRKI